MNLFEKIFNYQVISRLDDSGTITVTSHERAWLKTMLEHPAAAEAFTEDTKLKLVRLLEEQAPMDLSQGFIEKAKNEEKQVYHPLLRTLRRLIMKRSALRMTYRIKDGKLFTNQPGFPYKLEYSMVKKEWYLLWHHLGQRAFMSTRLQNIESVMELPFRGEDAEKLIAQIAAILESRKETAAIEVIPAYNRELSRILYAFSCFEKEVAYSADSDVYTITLSFRSDESEYVLSKLRFLGKRVRVVASDKLRRRMLESAAKALARYS